MNKVKEKLLNQQISTGGWIQIGHPAVAEIMAHAGFDWIAIDAEHSGIDIETGMNIMNAVKGTNTVPLVRVQENNEIVIRRWLDAGAEGLIVPLVNTAEQAKSAVLSAKYPPIGKRGFGFYRANYYGAQFDSYVKEFNDDVLVIVQIEHIEAIRNIDAILEVKGVDGAFIGPYDLSGSMDLIGKTDHPKVLEAIEIMLQACKKHNKAAGIHVIPVEPQKAKDFVNKGFTFVALSLDTVMLRYGCEKMLKR